MDTVYPHGAGGRLAPCPLPRKKWARFKHRPRRENKKQLSQDKEYSVLAIFQETLVQGKLLEPIYLQPEGTSLEGLTDALPPGTAQLRPRFLRGGSGAARGHTERVRGGLEGPTALVMGRGAPSAVRGRATGLPLPAKLLYRTGNIRASAQAAGEMEEILRALYELGKAYGRECGAGCLSPNEASGGWQQGCRVCWAQR